VRNDLRVATGGGLGGALNAWLCYARLPVPAGGATFSWYVVPAGALHGAALAVAALAAARILRTSTMAVRFAAAPAVAWLAGYISWIPLNRFAVDEPWRESLTWAWRQGWDLAILGPFQYFGLVSGLLYLTLVFGWGRIRRAVVWWLAAIACGVLGSLWWWVAVEPWYLSPLHGSIWGAAVAAASWNWVRSL
jgi:hypothetical protein